MHGQMILWQYMFNNVRPFDDYNGHRVASNLSQFVSDDSWFMQSIEVEVMHLFTASIIYLADSECWACDLILATQTANQTSSKGRFTAAKVAYQLNNFTAL